jgi:undecaprenyl-diphosphatase
MPGEPIRRRRATERGRRYGSWPPHTPHVAAPRLGSIAHGQFDDHRFAWADAMTWNLAINLSLAGPVVLAVVFAFPALEASTLLGIVIPGELALVLGGVLAHQGRVPLWAVVAVGSAGAVVGDSLGYALGRRFGERLLARLPRRLARRDRVERAKALVRRLGGRGVFVGRFAAGFRTLVPGLAGAAGMPYRTFAVYNVAGGVLWTTGSVLLGFGAGGAYRTAERIAGQAGLVVFGVIVVGATVAALVHRRRQGRRGQLAADRRSGR